MVGSLSWFVSALLACGTMLTSVTCARITAPANMTAMASFPTKLNPLRFITSSLPIAPTSLPGLFHQTADSISFADRLNICRRLGHQPCRFQFGNIHLIEQKDDLLAHFKFGCPIPADVVAKRHIGNHGGTGRCAFLCAFHGDFSLEPLRLVF